MSKKNESVQAALPVKSTNNTLLVSENKQSGNFVIVKSKLPFAVTFVTPDGQVHKINGMNQGFVVKTEGFIGLYATTQLSADAWAYFAKINANQPYMKKQIIFAEVKKENANDRAKEVEKDASTKTGMEQADPKNVPNIKKVSENKDDLGVDF